PLSNGSGAVESHRSLFNKFQIMIRVENPFVVAVRPLMRSHPLGANENLHPIRMVQRLHSKPRITARNGIPVLIHNNRGILVGPAARGLYIAESNLGKGKKMRLLLLIKL